MNTIWHNKNNPEDKTDRVFLMHQRLEIKLSLYINARIKKVFLTHDTVLSILKQKLISFNVIFIIFNENISYQ